MNNPFRRHIMPFLVLMTLISACTAPKNPVFGPNLPKFVIYYGHQEPPETFDPYDIIVFDREKHPDLAPLRNRPRQILAYVSIGEIHAHNPDRTRLDQAGAILSQNEIWKSYYVDVRHGMWEHFFLTHYIPDVIHQGFDGIMIDTADSALWMGEQHKVNTYDSLVKIIQSIRKSHPSLKIMLNRGFPLLSSVGDDINYLLAESILIDFDLRSNVGKLYPQDVLVRHVSFLQQAAQIHSGLAVFTLDYWNPQDVDGILRIYKNQRGWGFIPYVATPDLKRVVPEPVAPESPKQP